jgi:hypothetical protein
MVVGRSRPFATGAATPLSRVAETSSEVRCEAFPRWCKPSIVTGHRLSIGHGFEERPMSFRKFLREWFVDARTSNPFAKSRK